MGDVSHVEMPMLSKESLMFIQARDEMRNELNQRIDSDVLRQREIIVVKKGNHFFQAHLNVRPNAIEIEDMVSQQGGKPHVEIRVSSFGLSEAIWSFPVLAGYKAESMVLTSSIVTRDFDGNHHPYLFARDLFDHSWDHFVRNGYTPELILGNWNEGKSLGYNYAQFQDAVERIQQRTPEKDIQEIREIAAFETWTGKRASDRGFTKVLLVQGETFGLKDIKALFYK